jgi:uncharacterized protein YjbI with pentapeptide repeats
MTDPNPDKDRGEQQDEKWYGKTLYQVLLFALGVAFFGLVLGWILDWYIDPTTSTAKKDLVQALGLITAGVAGAVGIYFTWRSQRLTRKAQEENQRNTLSQLKNAEEQLILSRQAQEDNQRNTQEQLEQARNELDITRRGQITERFTHAIDQLGSESEEIRLGGIYSLERTAREDRDYHWPIMEVLTTYVRLHAPGRKKSVPPPEPEIQAILTVIARRSIYHRDVEYGPIDLNGSNLRKADLQEANLSGVNLRRADLEEANLSGVNLKEANLQHANLQCAKLHQALDLEIFFKVHNIDSANLDLGDRLMGLDPDNFRAANLQGADLQGADLRGAILHLANLSGAWLSGADLTGAELNRAMLRGAELNRAMLSAVVLTLADLSQAKLNEANLSGAWLRRVDLRGADLKGADLKNADLTYATGVTDEQLAGAQALEGITLPDGTKLD